MTAKDYWLSLEEPWRTAVTLAWEAYVGGNVGVGAVLTDPRGRIVAVGRNRGSLGSLLNAAKGNQSSRFSNRSAHARASLSGEVEGSLRAHVPVARHGVAGRAKHLAAYLGRIGPILSALDQGGAPSTVVCQRNAEQSTIERPAQKPRSGYRWSL